MCGENFNFSGSQEENSWSLIPPFYPSSQVSHSYIYLSQDQTIFELFPSHSSYLLAIGSPVQESMVYFLGSNLSIEFSYHWFAS